MSEETDKLFIDIALANGFLSGEQAEECRRALREATAAGERAGFLEVAQARGFLSSERVRDLRGAVETKVRVGEGAEARPERPGAAAPPPVIPGYEILQELGRGGMAVVYKARQQSPQRWVALKVMTAAGFSTEEARQRFMREADAAAALNHPGIVPVHHVGEHEHCLYYTMEYVDGDKLDVYLERHGLAVAEKLDLFQRVCEIVHYAHQHGVIHRDLKPSNIMVDRSGRVRVLDFGLAKFVSGRGARREDSELTLAGVLMGTPAYMSPEQTLGVPSEVDTRSDVYALGVILYRTLTGEFPYPVDSPSATDVIEHIRRDEPRRPSRIARRLRGDLETILLKALEKDKERRYSSVAELSGDVGRFLRDEPILARPAGTLRSAVKWVRRHQAASAVLSAVILAVVAVMGTISLSLVRVRAERDAAEREAYFANVTLAAKKIESGDVFSAEKALDRCPAPLRHWEWRRLKYLCAVNLVTLVGREPDASSVSCVVFSPDGKRLASARSSGNVQIWDLEARREVRLLRKCGGLIAFSPEGDRLAAALEQEVHLWDPASGAWTGLVGRHERLVRYIAFSPDGKRIISADSDGEVAWWDAEARRELRRFVLKGGPASGLATTVTLDRQGTRAACAAKCATAVRILDSDGQKELSLPERHSCPVFSLAFSPDGKRLASAGGDTVVRLWDAATGEMTGSLHGHGGWVTRVSFSPDGGRIASCGQDGKVMVWDSATERELLASSGPAPVESVAFSPDGKRIAAGDAKGAVRVWDVEAARGLLVLSAPTRLGFWRVAFNADGSRLLARPAGVAGAVLWVWDVATGRQVFRAEGPARFAVSPEGGWYAALEGEDTVGVWETASGRRFMTLKASKKPVDVLDFSSDGRRLLCAGGDEAEVWDRAEGRKLLSTRGVQRPIALSPDGLSMAASMGNGRVSVWDVNSRRPVCSFKGPAEPLTLMCFDQEGRRLALKGRSKVTVWNVPDNKLLLEAAGVQIEFDRKGKFLALRDGDEVTVRSLETGREVMTAKGYDAVLGFSTGREAILLADREGKVSLWDLATRREVFSVALGRRRFSSYPVAFSPDGKRLVAPTGAILSVWDVENARETLALRGHPGPVGAAAFSPDGRRLASASAGPDGTVIVWHSAFPDAEAPPAP